VGGIILGKILSEHECKKCKVRYVYDPYCSGDWHSTIYGYQLQAFCPICGDMMPIISERSPEEISNNNKKRILSKLATDHHLRYKEIMSIYHDRLKKIDDRVDFAKAVSKELKINFDEVKSLF
jgi:hypothetical protein